MRSGRLPAGSRGGPPSSPWARLGSVAPLLLVATLLPGCALLSKADVIGTRFFEPAIPHAEASMERATTAAGAPVTLILGRATASSYLKRRLVYRTSGVEMGTYEDRQWTERPEQYAARAVAHALFDARGVTEVLAGSHPTLELDLAAFEEIRRDGRSVGRVTIRFVLHDESTVWIRDAITVDEAPADGSQRPEAVVAALSTALTRAAREVAEVVTARLRAGGPRGGLPCEPAPREGGDS